MNVFGIKAGDDYMPVVEFLVKDFANKLHINHINIAHEEWLKHGRTHDAIMLIGLGFSSV